MVPMIISEICLPQTHCLYLLILSLVGRQAAHEIVDSLLKKATEISNANFIRNANYLFSAMAVESSVKWVGKDKKIFVSSN